MIETTELYGGEIKLEFDSGRHQYHVVNKERRYKVPSVTRITSVLDKSAPLMGWAINQTLDVVKGAIAPGTEYAEIYLEAVWDAAKKQSRQTKQEAADKGHQVHKEIESHLRGIATGDLAAFERIRELCTFLADFRVDSAERKLFSRRHRYSGTTDAIAQDGRGNLILFDWKTGKSIYPEFRLQTAAYVKAYEEEFPSQKIEGRYLVRIAEDGSIDPHYYPRSTLRLDFKGFLGAKALFDRVQQIEKEMRKEKK